VEGESIPFEQVTLPELSLEVHEYRTGSDKVNAVRKLPGIHKVGDVTMKRGVTGSLYLYAWWKMVQDGHPQFRRNVKVTLLNEARESVLAWKLFRAFPVKFRSGPLSAGGNEVLIEELVLCGERLELE